MIKVYVHNTKDWISEQYVFDDFFGVELIWIENLWYVFKPTEWTEIGEL